mmetsp:Transcript_5344/g.19270  ORF Transcript_5344/g.19270 Transcript_5344/m.19270 type:complete len:384 (-) Transcript_5344:300-1451(-)
MAVFPRKLWCKSTSPAPPAASMRYANAYPTIAARPLIFSASGRWNRFTQTHHGTIEVSNKPSSSYTAGQSSRALRWTTSASMTAFQSVSPSASLNWERSHVPLTHRGSDHTALSALAARVAAADDAAAARAAARTRSSRASFARFSATAAVQLARRRRGWGGKRERARTTKDARTTTKREIRAGAGTSRAAVTRDHTRRPPELPRRGPDSGAGWRRSGSSRRCSSGRSGSDRGSCCTRSSGCTARRLSTTTTTKKGRRWTTSSRRRPPRAPWADTTRVSWTRCDGGRTPPTEAARGGGLLTTSRGDEANDRWSSASRTVSLCSWTATTATTTRRAARRGTSATPSAEACGRSSLSRCSPPFFSSRTPRRPFARSSRTAGGSAR